MFTVIQERKRGGSRPFAPHFLLLLLRSGAQLGRFVLHLLFILPKPCPHPSKNNSCIFIFHPFSNPQSLAVLPFPTQAKRSQRQISRLYSPAASPSSPFFLLMAALLPPLSPISVYLALMSFLLPVLHFVDTHV